MAEKSDKPVKAAKPAAKKAAKKPAKADNPPADNAAAPAAPSE